MAGEDGTVSGRVSPGGWAPHGDLGSGPAGQGRPTGAAPPVGEDSIALAATGNMLASNGDGGPVASPLAETDDNLPSLYGPQPPTTGHGERSSRPEAAPHPRNAALRAGTMVNSYRVSRVLGEGAMGTVYAGEEPSIGKKVAIKVLKRALATDPAVVGRFKQEAWAVNQARSRYIVDIFLFGELPDGRHYFVMEHIDGKPLRDYLDDRESKPLSLDEAYQVLGAIARGLIAAHGKGIVHRDLKPENIMVMREEDGRLTAKLLDFGIAKLVGSAASEVAFETAHGAAIGTPYYMSPEQVRGVDVDHRTDVYALGVIMFELFAGARPFAAESYIEIVNHHLFTRPPGPRERSADISEPLERLILRCLAKDPAERPQGAQEFLEELVRTRGGDGVAPPSREELGAQAILIADLVESTDLVFKVGDRRARGIMDAYAAGVRELVQKFEGRQIPTPDGLLILFPRTIYAVAFACDYHDLLTRLAAEHALGDRPLELAASVGIHLGDVVLETSCGGGRTFISGVAGETAAHIMSAGVARQTLLSREAFNNARLNFRAAKLPEGLQWHEHGPYFLHGLGLDEPVVLCEVGLPGRSPLSAPQDSAAVKRATADDEKDSLSGWRPAPEQPVPRRPDWVLEAQLGTGGFGEVWLALNETTREKRTFKFCFDKTRVNSLKRELKLFLILKKHGRLKNITPLYEVNLTEPPYSLEMGYAEGGDLVQWLARNGGTAAVSLEDRIDIVAQVADALAEAHSIPLLHGDVKPSNILVRSVEKGPSGSRLRVELADLGVGQVLDQRVLDDADLTRGGFTEAPLASSSSSVSHSGSSGFLMSSGGRTKMYCAPELDADLPAHTQSDIYALGVVLYQLAVGDELSGRVHTLADGTQRQDAPRPFNKRLPDRHFAEIHDPLLRADIAACLESEPDRRPSAKEIAQRLRTLPERRRAARRTKWRWRGIVAAISLILVATPIFLLQRHKAQIDLHTRLLLRSMAQATAARIDQLIGDTENLARQLSSDPGIAATLQAEGEPQTHGVGTNEFLDLVGSNYPDVSRVYLLDHSGRCRATSGKRDILGEDYSERPYFEEPLRDNEVVYVSNARVGKTSNAKGIYISAPIVRESRFLGVVVIKLEGDRVQELLGGGDDGRRTMVVDDCGIIVFDSEDGQNHHRSLTAVSTRCHDRLRAEGRLQGSPIEPQHLAPLWDEVQPLAASDRKTACAARGAGGSTTDEDGLHGFARVCERRSDASRSPRTLRPWSWIVVVSEPR